MLLTRRVLEGIVAGRIDLAFRSWRRPTVKAGGRLRTSVGVLQIDAVDVVEPADIDEDDARRAGFASREALLTSLAERGGRGGEERRLYRIRLHLAGPDPRVALRQADHLEPAEVAQIMARLQRLDRASRHGPWTRATLLLIGRRPGTRAAELASEVGRPRDAFKADVRKLKELGLTESLGTGYRLSPRGEAYLSADRSGPGG